MHWVCVPPDPRGYEAQWDKAQRLLAARRRLRDFAPVPEAEWRRRALCSLAPRWPAEPQTPPGTPRHDREARLSAVGWVKRSWRRVHHDDGFPSTASIASAPYRQAILRSLDDDTDVAAALAALAKAARFMHHARWGRPCLALDLIEEFRPVIVDAMVLRCLSAGIVRFEEFETTPDKGCRMSARARQAFLAAYERRMLTVFTHEPTGRRVSYRVEVGLQAKALARAVIDPDRGYRSVRWK